MSLEREQLLESIAATLSSIVPRSNAPFDPERTFADLGLDSLGRVELVAELERAHAVLVDDAAYRTLHTPGDVAEYLLARLS